MSANEDSPKVGGRRKRPGRRMLATFASADSYGLILVLVVLTYLVSVSFETGWAQSLVIGIQLVTVWLTFRTAKAALSVRAITLLVIGAAVVVALANVFVTVTSQLLAVTFVISAVLYLVAPYAVVRDIATRRAVDQQTVLGAITAYLIVGMCFAFTYRTVAALQPTPFFGSSGPGDMSDALFFSFVTLTTTGYGNLVPATNPGQSLAVLEAVLGQLFLVTAVAKIITAWKPRRWRSSEEPE
jgi:hypothetical protein